MWGFWGGPPLTKITEQSPVLKHENKGISSFWGLDLPWEMVPQGWGSDPPFPACPPLTRSTMSQVWKITDCYCSHTPQPGGLRGLGGPRYCSSVSPASFLSPVGCLCSQGLPKHCLPGLPTLSHNHTGCPNPTTARRRPLWKWAWSKDRETEALPSRWKEGTAAYCQAAAVIIA